MSVQQPEQITRYVHGVGFRTPAFLLPFPPQHRGRPAHSCSVRARLPSFPPRHGPHGVCGCSSVLPPQSRRAPPWPGRSSHCWCLWLHTWSGRGLRGIQEASPPGTALSGNPTRSAGSLAQGPVGGRVALPPRPESQLGRGLPLSAPPPPELPGSLTEGDSFPVTFIWMPAPEHPHNTLGCRGVSRNPDGVMLPETLPRWPHSPGYAGSRGALCNEPQNEPGTSLASPAQF